MMLSAVFARRNFENVSYTKKRFVRVPVDDYLLKEKSNDEETPTFGKSLFTYMSGFTFYCQGLSQLLTKSMQMTVKKIFFI